jgi:excisionase family DNA binding protein
LKIPPFDREIPPYFSGNLSTTRNGKPFLIVSGIGSTLQNSTPPQLHTITTVGERTSLSRSALYREIQAGRLHALKVGKALRISEAELQRFINALEGQGDK